MSEDEPRQATPQVQALKAAFRVAIQGELGSNSHMAALEMLGPQATAMQRTLQIVPCAFSADVVNAVVQGRVDAAVLPIENSLHGSVAEHYDLLMEQPVAIVHESLLRIRHNLMALPGVKLEDLRFVLSHPVALSQCKRYLSELAVTRKVRALPFYDTAGSVKHVVAERLTDSGGIAPELAAEQYGAEILVRGIEDHTENYTRFHVLRAACAGDQADSPGEDRAVDKMSVAFAVEHKPGSLVRALQSLAHAGVDLTQIESRPVPGKPWEYVFYVDLRVADGKMADQAITALQPACGMVKELGRYREARSRG